jgi:chromosome segregation ATPase
MSDHKSLRTYEDIFGNAVNNLSKSILNKLVDIVDYLKRYHDIRIYYNEGNSNIDTARNIISALESRKYYLISQINSIKQDDYVQRIKRNIRTLKNEHEENMKKIRNDFEKKASKLNNVSYTMVRLNRDIKDRNDQISILKDEKYELQNRKNSKEKFMEEQKSIMENKFRREKDEIDSKYYYIDSIPYPTKEYTQEEKNLKNFYLQKIRNIRNYPIPESLIKGLELINYLY